MAATASTSTPTYARSILGRNRETFKLIVVYGLMILLTVILAYPFYYLATASFKTTEELFRYPPTLIPEKWTLDNFRGAFEVVPLLRMALNTFVICLIAVTGSILSNSLAAFAIARLRFPLRSIIFGAMLTTLMIPGWISLVPAYMFWRDVGRFTTNLIGINLGVNSIGPLVIPSFLTSAFAVFLMRQYFLTIPKELEEAARIDGASFFRIYWSVFLPLSFPVLAVIGIGAFMGSWNDVLGPLIYLSKPESQTIMVGLSYFNSQHMSVIYRGSRFAAALVAAIPVLTLYFFANKYLIRGIVLGGLK
ncbi:MAG: carbohydrate ABC transporter permease [Chloroflexi bacterium]|jgi:multiple sugar transport system permease protein|uniref:Sugar ABC transporter ATP-binding protein n=1 Tax=Candidatus Thermofonsia Clade 3 bacterium TaxID=2364212 RepID=A0A2M8QF34_9CHLR|nr:carbohydrate ABC transporter permease [Candidatus Roseilinea sp. NK_OTU-006]PJF48362.1 MAG: sugar ABC transporter ATP-binding protein [Candidatus Thermofonsia Clade 3 bacterium]RMG62510.1 MAG: carbohydrate ABC transporter permease [Chloroflexota bacterium]